MIPKPKMTRRKPKPSLWNQAIREAENRIVELKSQISGLRSSIKVFAAKAESGEPWPGEKTSSSTHI